ncbi:solute transporter [Penicillium lagena]|uniref:solute transporter n=1 Tax=Penicillium lagena TaxID=94218 RepID=UPI0025410D0C|nr:solute transporter [Penicillium lagena]KAJ5601744.1 solute transporter [Penicillium lagena]
MAKVFTNKSIFSHESLRKCQMAFTSFHFLITSITLWIMSRPCLGGFVAKSIPPHRILHLAGLMCAQIVLQNISLAYSSVIFHQLVRLLLTPITALSNFLLYQATIPKASIMPLVIMCSGVGIVFYYDTVTTAAGGETTSPTGAFAAIVGVCSSALYTTLVGRYHKKFDVTSMQLLLNQSSLGTGLLLCSVPFFDTLPSMNALSGRLYTSLLLSGLCAFLVNLSQFYVIEASGPVSSTVVGHFKTCMIIGLGWMVSGHSTMSQSIAGVFMALVGMSW